MNIFQNTSPKVCKRICTFCLACVSACQDGCRYTVAPIHIHQRHLAKLALALSQTFSRERAGSDRWKRPLQAVLKTATEKNEEAAAASIAAATEISVDSAALNKRRPL